MELRKEILAAGEALGFRRPRVTTITPLPRAEFLAQWLAEGRAGDMRYLEHHRKARIDPRTRYPWARSLVSAAVPYRPPPAPPIDWRDQLRGRIAAYALGRDYHDLIASRLAAWSIRIAELAPGVTSKGYVDTGAVLEHEWAARAGVGWTGKHTLTLSEDAGSYYFLAELLLSVELEPDVPVAERCGTCTRCIDVCPTGAIERGYRLEPRRCISYLTIEHRGAIDPALRPLLGEWVFGCDLCQVVCPWNGGAQSPPNPDLAPNLAALLMLDEAGFTARYGKSAVKRAGRSGLARNAAVVLGNTGNPAAVTPLARALAEHDAPLVRGHAAWSLGRLSQVASRAARRALERSLLDPDPSVQAEARLALV